MKKKSIFVFIMTMIICTGCHFSGGPAKDTPGDVPVETDNGEDDNGLGTDIEAGTETPGTEAPVTASAPLQIETPAGGDGREPGIAEAQKSNRIDLQPICQYPELPTGCEITSLAMALNYNGIPADKCDLADHYLDKGEVGTVDFRIAFEGDPRDESSYGCYSPVIVNTANRYLQAVQSDLEAIDISGGELEDLFTYIDAGVPVIVWGTLDCAEGHYSVTWNVGGEDLTWYTPEHCMVLVGYEDGQVWAADPVYGDVRNYDINIFRSRYEALYRQAIVIQ